MMIEILGDGCSKCRQLKLRTEEALAELGLSSQVKTVVDPRRLAEHRVLSLPGLIIDGEVHSGAGSLSVDQIKALLRRASK